MGLANDFYYFDIGKNMYEEEEGDIEEIYRSSGAESSHE